MEPDRCVLQIRVVLGWFGLLISLWIGTVFLLSTHVLVSPTTCPSFPPLLSWLEDASMPCSLNESCVMKILMIKISFLSWTKKKEEEENHTIIMKLLFISFTLSHTHPCHIMSTIYHVSLSLLFLYSNLAEIFVFWLLSFFFQTAE